MNTTRHTVQFPQCFYMRTHAWIKFGSALSPSHPCLMRIVCSSDCLDISIHFFFLVFLLSDHPVLLSARQLHLPRCGGQISCATPLRTLAPWPRTSLPHSQHISCFVWSQHPLAAFNLGVGLALVHLIVDSLACL